jgi:hypothetical protein
MEPYIIETDIPCYQVKATSFPDGVLAVHQLVHSLFAFDGKKRFFGISRPEGKGLISYWAAVEKMDDDNVEDERLENFIIPKGKYIGTNIQNFRTDIPAIGKTFQKLLEHPQLDPMVFALNGIITWMMFAAW